MKINDLIDLLKPYDNAEIDQIFLKINRQIVIGLKPDKESIPMDTEVKVQIADIVNKYGLECPNSNNCGNKGTLAEHGCDGTEEDCARTCPVPVQCEFCYCEPKSKFNLENDLQELIKSKFSE